MAMAEMMEEDEGDRKVEQGQGDQLNLMHFTTAQENTYGKQDQIYNFINDFSYYFSSFYNNQISEKTIDNVTSNLTEVEGTNPTLKQKI